MEFGDFIDVQLSPVDVSPSGQVILGTRDLESPEGISRNSIYSANFDSVKKSVDFDALAPSTWEIAVGDVSNHNAKYTPLASENFYHICSTSKT